MWKWETCNSLDPRSPIGSNCGHLIGVEEAVPQASWRNRSPFPGHWGFRSYTDPLLAINLINPMPWIPWIWHVNCIWTASTWTDWYELHELHVRKIGFSLRTFGPVHRHKLIEPFSQPLFTAVLDSWGQWPMETSQCHGHQTSLEKIGKMPDIGRILEAKCLGKWGQWGRQNFPSHEKHRWSVIDASDL